jgi:Ser/Thr protein kinase RdoA (MazF antagonist)
VLEWCGQVFGPIKLLSDHTRHHPGDRTATLRIETSNGICYVKIHRTPDRWAQEVHGYEAWAPVFGEFAPKLLAVRDEAPLALVVSAIEGKPLDEVRLSTEKEKSVWNAAGRALSSLHQAAVGNHFCPCDRAGNCIGEPTTDPVAYVSNQLQHDLDKGVQAGHLTSDEQAVVRAAIDLTPVYAGLAPVPCHRDYCPPNLLVNETGEWVGVIDFEFAHWDVAATDFARDPNWNWMDRPEMMDAFFEGYGQHRSATEEQQYLVCLVRYGLSAIVWGMDNDYFGFAREGREALVRLAPKVGTSA